jgi:outer membrane lipoprotein-sorting protein
MERRHNVFRNIAVIGLLAVFCSAAAAAEKGLTSQDVLKKMSEAYKAANTYYEQGSFDVKRGGQTMPQVSGKYALAFKRPDTLRWETDAYGGLVLFHEKNRLTALFVAKNKYGNYDLDLDKSLIFTGLPGMRARFAPDPYEYITSGGATVGPLAVSELGNKRFYAIELQSEGQSQKLFIDQETFLVAGIDGKSGDEEVAVRVTKTVVNEPVKDAEGKVIDVFEFKIPADATEVRAAEKDTKSK